MSDRTDKDRQEEQAAFDGLAAATAVSFAVASRTMEMWFGVMSGFARASREMVAPHLDAQMRASEKAEPKAPTSKPSTAAQTEDSADVVELSSRRKRSRPSESAPAKAEHANGKRAPQATERPETVDDFKRIDGIGPKLEQVLNGFGVWTYAQIADWQAEEIAWVDDALGLDGRIAADNWLAQADALLRAGMQNKDVAAG